MSAELSWYNENTIVCAFSGAFSVENYATLEGQLPMMIQERSDRRISVILYLRHDAELPDLRGILQKIGILINVMPPNFGLFVGVGEHLLLSNPLAVLIVRMLLPLYDEEMVKYLDVASSLEAASVLIQRRSQIQSSM